MCCDGYVLSIVCLYVLNNVILYTLSYIYCNSILS